MRTAFRRLSARELLTTQVPAIGISLLIAEFFYKFQSFALECVAFLATWYVVDWAIELLKSLFTRTNYRPGAS
jgi:hypothetical protein